MMTKKTMMSLFAMLLVVAMMLSIVGCTESGTNNPTGTSKPSTNNNPTDPVEDPNKKIENPIVFSDGDYTYNDYTSLSPSNWNELTYQDNNDTQIMSYLGSSFFGFDFEYDEYGEIVPGGFTVNYQAATKLTDVTAKYAEAWGLPADGSGYAWQITLRDDLTWHDGTPIKAEDFVYTIEQLLDPKFQNYRADTVYLGSTILINAQNYYKQGQSGWFAADDPYSTYSEDLDSLIVFSLAPSSDEVPAQASFRDSMGFPASYDASMVAAYLIGNYLGESGFTAEVAASMEGKTMAEIKADPALKAGWDALIGWWQTDPDEELDFFITNYTYPETSFDKVGIFVGETEYDIVIVLQNALPLLNDDGSLSYHCAYDMSSLPLVKKDLYESCKQEPASGSELWTSNYNSSVETTASWGPYMLESFQTGTQYTLTRNTKWYGYYLAKNDGLYMTDRIVCDTIQEWNTAWLQFLAGELDGISIDVSVAPDYKGSDRAYFTPSDFVSSMQLQSSMDALKAREEAGINKSILGYTSFRKALSLAVNRAEYTKQCTTSSQAGFGLFNSMHYYDVANGGVYRETDEAKQVLCDTYGVDVSKYASLDEAVESITGYNVDLARELLTEAYNEALANGDIKAGDKVVLTMGTGSINESVTRQMNFIGNAWKEMAVGTPLEGLLDYEIKDFGDVWATDFMGGAYDVCFGGWTGAAWNPGYFLMAYLDPGTAFSAAWDTTAEMMEFTMKGVGENGADITDTMSLMDWYYCLNGDSSAKYDFSSNALEESQRLQLIAALEGQVLQHYYSVPVANSFSASMLSFKVDYITYEYNTFMGYGGMKYMTYNFNDAEWAAAVAEQGGELNYK